MVIKYQIEVLSDEQVHQGDIFKSVQYYDNFVEQGGRFELSLLRFPYSIILTQECDLNNNLKERKSIDETLEIRKQDKYLISLLCAPLYNAEHLFTGNHLSFFKNRSSKEE